MTMTSSSTIFHSKNGRLIHIRPLQKGDAPLLISIFEHMGSGSRYHRFHQSVDSPNPNRVQREAEQMVASVPDNSFGLIALDGDAPVGAVRYVIFGDGDRAETAVSIIDDYQNSGIGSELVALLAQEAQKRSINQLVASVQAENIAALHILEKLPFPHNQRLDGSVVEVMIDLTAVTH